MAENAQLRSEVGRLVDENGRLTAKIVELEHRMDKGSKNSSKPPSSDSIRQKAEATKTRADRRSEAKAKRREELERRRGKQSGAPGHNLMRKAEPDEIIEHEPESCGSCGGDLSDEAIEGTECRQVFDTPLPLPLRCTEHRSIARRCSCGKVTKGTFPIEAKATTCYGPNVRAAVLYLVHRQHIPVERTAEALSAMFQAPVSTGFVSSLAKEAAGRLDDAGFTEEIRERLRRSHIVHVDETTDQVGTDTWWFHVVSNDLYTHLFASPTRGKDAPDEAGVLADFSGVMVHDRLAMYFKYEKATHAICAAHLYRDLKSVSQIFGQGWASDMALLLEQMNGAAHLARGKGMTGIPARKLKGFLQRYDDIVANGLAANRVDGGHRRDTLEREGYNLARALCDLKAEATRFATDLSVPHTNNEAERSLRMAKLHKKISGGFQSADGARAFATIRSYLSTAKKHEVDMFAALTALFRGDVWIPPAIT